MCETSTASSGGTAFPIFQAGMRGRRVRSGCGPSRAAVSRAQTSASMSELDARRFAPWSPVEAHSPTAESPGIEVRPSVVAWMPPQL